MTDKIIQEVLKELRERHFKEMESLGLKISGVEVDIWKKVSEPEMLKAISLTIRKIENLCMEKTGRLIIEDEQDIQKARSDERKKVAQEIFAELDNFNISTPKFLKSKFVPEEGDGKDEM